MHYSASMTFTIYLGFSEHHPHPGLCNGLEVSWHIHLQRTLQQITRLYFNNKHSTD